MQGDQDSPPTEVLTYIQHYKVQVEQATGLLQKLSEVVMQILSIDSIQSLLGVIKYCGKWYFVERSTTILATPDNVEVVIRVGKLKEEIANQDSPEIPRFRGTRRPFRSKINYKYRTPTLNAAQESLDYGQRRRPIRRSGTDIDIMEWGMDREEEDEQENDIDSQHSIATDHEDINDDDEDITMVFTKYKDNINADLILCSSDGTNKNKVDDNSVGKQDSEDNDGDKPSDYKEGIAENEVDDKIDEIAAEEH